MEEARSADQWNVKEEEESKENLFDLAERYYDLAERYYDLAERYYAETVAQVRHQHFLRVVARKTSRVCWSTCRGATAREFRTTLRATKVMKIG